MEGLNKNAVAIREIGNSKRCFIDHEKTNATIRESQQVEASIISFGLLDFQNYQGQREPCTDLHIYGPIHSIVPHTFSHISPFH